MTKTKPWTDQHEKKYMWLYNYIKTIKPDINKDDYLKKINKRELISLIKKNAAWSDGSREGIYFMIARWLELNNPGDTNVSWFQELGYDIKKKRDEEEGKNKLDEKEKENFKEHSFFINLLESINPNDIKTLREHYKYLALALMTLQPPLRTSFYTSAHFVTKHKDINTDENYVLLIKQGRRRAYYIVNKDKASNYKEYAKNKNLSEIEIEDPKLVDILYNSYETHPREYLFQSGETTITQETFLKLLRDITGLSGLTVDMMRASYVTHFYDENKQFVKRDELSKKMRHSVNTASKNYYKVLEDEKPMKKDEEIEKLKKENDELQAKILLLEQRLKSYEGNPKIYAKRRRDTLYALNVKKSEPREDTLKKYNIKYDSEKEMYV